MTDLPRWTNTEAKYKGLFSILSPAEQAASTLQRHYSTYNVSICKQYQGRSSHPNLPAKLKIIRVNCNSPKLPIR